MLQCLKQFTKLFISNSLLKVNASTTSSLIKRLESGESDSGGDPKYNPYPGYETPSPYRNRKGIKRFYEYKLFTSGILPRPSGEWEDIPVPMPKWDPQKLNAWTSKKALFGQNDYIDILGDGTVHPWELLSAPPWLKGFKGNEMQRLIRRLGVQGEFLKDTYPSKYHQIMKQIRYLHQKLNRRRRAPYWGGYRRFSRIDKPVI